MKIQKELDETKIVLHKTIESVLERGEKIDSLVEKSDGLSAQSKMFYKQVCLLLLPIAFCHVDAVLPAGKATKFLLCNYVSYTLYYDELRASVGQIFGSSPHVGYPD